VFRGISFGPGDLNMRKMTFYFGLLLCFAISPLFAYGSQGCPECGAVTGNIRVWKTKVKTKGPKSDKEVVVFLKPVADKAFPPVKRSAVMDQLGLLFIPHILAIQKGTTVEFKNSDNDKHNVYFLFDKTGETLDIGTKPPGESAFHAFEDTGVVITLCKLHLEMAAYVVVLDNPHFTEAVIDGDKQKGPYRIEGVPPGDYILQTWHKKLKMKGKSARVTVESGKTTEFDIIITKRKYAK
jgi:plastocyanin